MWNLFQQQQIGELRVRSGDASAAAAQAQRHAEAVERQLNGLLLTCMAMWEIMQQKLGTTEQELMDRVREIDLRDGQLDGKVSGVARTSSRCGRTMSMRHQRCIYRGGEKLNAGGFDAAR